MKHTFGEKPDSDKLRQALRIAFTGGATRRVRKDERLPLSLQSVLRPLLLHAFLLGFALHGITQPDSQEAKQKLTRQALQLIEEGKFDEGMKQLEWLAALYPTDPEFPLQQGIAWFGKEEYGKAIHCIAPAFESGKADARHYQLFGNSLDMMDSVQAAREVYQQGIVKFPHAGALYMELGILCESEGKATEALGWWERGIDADPMFGTNYYLAAKGWNQRDEPFHVLMYGEIFMNLEQNSERIGEISLMLWSVWKRHVFRLDDGALEFRTDHRTSLQAGTSLLNLWRHPASFADRHLWLMNNWMSTYGYDDSLSVKVVAGTMGYVSRTWKRLSPSDLHPLMHYRSRMLRAGMMEPYVCWLLGDGAPEEVIAWVKKNSGKSADFEKWFREHPLRIERSAGHRVTKI